MLNDADIPYFVTITSTGAVRASGISTFTTTAPHGLQVGNVVNVASVSNPTFNATLTIFTVPTATTFQVIQAGADASSGNGVVANIIQGDWAVDAVLLPLANKAYRKVQQALYEAGSKTQTTEAFLTLQANATQLLDSTDPQLPVDFLAPRTFMERQHGSGLAYIPMAPVDELPSFSDSATLVFNRIWAWYDEGIFFPGSTVAMDIRMRYIKGRPDISGADGVFEIRGCQDVIADWTAFLADQSRGGANANSFAALYQDDMKQLLNMQAHARQYKVSRRQPFNAGRRRGRSIGTIL